MLNMETIVAEGRGLDFGIGRMLRVVVAYMQLLLLTSRGI